MRSLFRSNPPPPPPDPPPPTISTRRARARESWHLTKLPSIRRHLYLLAFSVLLLMSMIALYLGLFLKLGPKLTKTYHVFLVSVIALAALFVGYAVVRVYFAVEKERKLRRGEKGRVPVEERRRRRREESYQPPPTPRTVAYGEYGYAMEGVGVEEHYQPGNQARPPPPVYGQWRQSIRINPTDLHYYTPAPPPPPPATTYLQRNPTTASTVSSLSVPSTNLHRNPTSASTVSELSTVGGRRMVMHTTRPGSRGLPVVTEEGEERRREKERERARAEALAKLGGERGVVRR